MNTLETDREIEIVLVVDLRDINGTPSLTVTDAANRRTVVSPSKFDLNGEGRAE